MIVTSTTSVCTRVMEVATWSSTPATASGSILLLIPAVGIHNLAMTTSASKQIVEKRSAILKYYKILTFFHFINNFLVLPLFQKGIKFMKANYILKILFLGFIYMIAPRR